MIDNSTSLRDFLFRGLMLESEAERFQSAGIQMAHLRLIQINTYWLKLWHRLVSRGETMH